MSVSVFFYHRSARTKSKMELMGYANTSKKGRLIIFILNFSPQISTYPVPVSIFLIKITLVLAGLCCFRFYSLP